MAKNAGACGCSQTEQETPRNKSVSGNGEQAHTREAVLEIVDYKVTMLIAAGAAMAANCEPCINKIVPDLIEAGVAEKEIQNAVKMGQFVKDKPAALMKEAADALTGTHMSDEPAPEVCPADTMQRDPNFKLTMLIAAGAAMAANCVSCLNKVVPVLIEAGVAKADIRRAVEIGQFVKDKPADIMKETADALTGSRLSQTSASTENGCPAEKMKKTTASA